MAARLLEDEEEPIDKKDVDGEKEDLDGADAEKTPGAKKALKKKKGLTSEILKDERFKTMFEDKVL